MRVLKVVAGTSTGSTVFELGRKAKSYDWDKAELLTDCLSQVFSERVLFGRGISKYISSLKVSFSAPESVCRQESPKTTLRAKMTET